MKTKKDIVKDWITRYSGIKITAFEKFILLTNFQKYVDEFAKINNVNVDGLDKHMPSATHENITIINFGMGSPNAATIMDLLSAIKPKAVLFLGKCGGLKKRINIGDFIFLITKGYFFCIKTSTNRLLDRNCFYNKQKGLGI